MSGLPHCSRARRRALQGSRSRRTGASARGKEASSDGSHKGAADEPPTRRASLRSSGECGPTPPASPPPALVPPLRSGEGQGMRTCEASAARTRSARSPMPPSIRHGPNRFRTMLSSTFNRSDLYIAGRLRCNPLLVRSLVIDRRSCSPATRATYHAAKPP